MYSNNSVYLDAYTGWQTETVGDLFRDKWYKINEKTVFDRLLNFLWAMETQTHLNVYYYAMFHWRSKIMLVDWFSAEVCELFKLINISDIKPRQICNFEALHKI